MFVCDEYRICEMALIELNKKTIEITSFISFKVRKPTLIKRNMLLIEK